MRVVNRHRTRGASLVAELASVVIFSVSILSMSQLLNASVNKTKQLNNFTHAKWMADDIFTRMSIRPTDRRANVYSQSNTTLNCSATSTGPGITDLQSVFCSPNQFSPPSRVFSSPAAHIPNLQWSIQCVSGSGVSCPDGSTIRLEISWPDNTSESGDGNSRFTFDKEVVFGI